MPRRIIFLLILAAVCLSPVLSQQLDSLLAMRDSTVINEEQLDLQLQIAYVLSDTDIRRAVDLAYNALRDAEALGSARWTAEAKLAIGRFYDFLGVNEEAAGLLMEAFASFVTLGDSLKQATTLMHIGNNYFYVDQFEPALQYFHMVSDFGRELKDTSLIISGLNSTAAVYGNTNRMDSALVLFREAHALAREFGSLEQEILALYNIGDVHLYSGRRTQALEFFHDLENYYNLRVNSPKYLSSLYNSMTKAYLEKQNLQLAREYSEKTL